MNKSKITTLLLLSIFLSACSKEYINVENIIVQSNEIYLNANKELSLNVEIIPNDATNKKLNYKSSNKEVFQVDKNGKLKGISIGSAKLIISTSDSKSIINEINVYVVDKVWPENKILEYVGFTLPEFPDYTKVFLENNEDIKRMIK